MPSPSCIVHVFEVAYGSQVDQSVFSLEKHIWAIPATLSVALKLSVIIGVSTLMLLGVIDPVGAVLSNLTPVKVMCGSSIMPVP